MRDNKNEKAVILLSGGVDSATTLVMAKAEGYALYAISFDYGQRHFRELESARMVAENLGVEKHLIVNFDLREIGGSALTSEIEVPKIKRPGSEGHGQQESEVRSQKSEVKNSGLRTQDSGLIPVTYVPARNTIFLSFALGWAEVLGAANIYIGANAVDYSGYPDCRPEYLRAFEDMANLATKASVEGKTRFSIKAPLLFMTKAEIIKKGSGLGLDYSLTWSCYDPQPADAEVQSSKFKVQSENSKLQGLNSELRTPNSELIPCCRCDSCLFRAKGFREAGVIDPLLSG